MQTFLSENFFTILKSEFLKEWVHCNVSEPFLQRETTFYDFWFASLDKEIISKCGLLIKEFENLLLEEQNLPLEELDLI